MNITLIKLVTGEEVLGEDVSNELGFIKLKNPVKVATVRGQDGNPNIGFAPFPTFSDEQKDKTVAFLREHVVYYYEPAEDFRKNYDSIFGLGLILPGQQQIITG
jgi:hypothetical protein